MRPGQNNFKNRNRNRNRRHGGGNGGGGGGGNPGNRVLDSNGPDVKLRGTAQTIAEKYMQLARDAASAGDRVMAESYYQHADHYYRLWLAAQPAGQPIQFSRRLDEDVEDLEGGADSEDEAAEAGAEGAEGSEAAAPAEGAAPEGEAPASDDQGQRNFRPRENREQGNRDQQGGRERFRNNRWPRRGDRNQEPRDGSAPVAEAAPEEAGDRGERQERPERPERSDRAERNDRPERAPRRERVEAAAASAGDGGDWEAPSFLKRPMPATSNGGDGEATEASAQPERRPRARRPRYGEEGVTPNEPAAGEE